MSTYYSFITGIILVFSLRNGAAERVPELTVDNKYFVRLRHA